MLALYVLKGLGLVAATAVAELWAHGDLRGPLVLLAIIMLVSMWYATRLRARRRARGEPA